MKKLYTEPDMDIVALTQTDTIGNGDLSMNDQNTNTEEFGGW